MVMVVGNYVGYGSLGNASGDEWAEGLLVRHFGCLLDA